IGQESKLAKSLNSREEAVKAFDYRVLPACRWMRKNVFHLSALRPEWLPAAQASGRQGRGRGCEARPPFSFFLFLLGAVCCSSKPIGGLLSEANRFRDGIRCRWPFTHEKEEKKKTKTGRDKNARSRASGRSRRCCVFASAWTFCCCFRAPCFCLAATGIGSSSPSHVGLLTTTSTTSCSTPCRRNRDTQMADRCAPSAQ
ncbi:hypothetical protein MAPG_00777, partial [Magnaporthiopsis poae ATCC 64411]|uniref:Uncharacterized protein n=1 Tax=Magnaporthiopsis poae (strain ATCC 64411 / 73-15) TaxID=644358 RepID=A0A0C4DLX7_MAGP6